MEGLPATVVSAFRKVGNVTEIVIARTARMKNVVSYICLRLYISKLVQYRLKTCLETYFALSLSLITFEEGSRGLLVAKK